VILFVFRSVRLRARRSRNPWTTSRALQRASGPRRASSLALCQLSRLVTYVAHSSLPEGEDLRMRALGHELFDEDGERQRE
jgi:hypothetical protein